MKATTSMSKSCTSSSIVDLSKDREASEHKRRSLPPSKNDDETSKTMRVSVDVNVVVASLTTLFNDALKVDLRL